MDVDAPRTGRRHGGNQHLVVLAAQQTAFPGVGIESREGDLAPGMAVEAGESVTDRVGTMIPP